MDKKTTCALARLELLLLGLLKMQSDTPGSLGLHHSSSTAAALAVTQQPTISSTVGIQQQQYLTTRCLGPPAAEEHWGSWRRVRSSSDELLVWNQLLRMHIT